MTQKQLFSKRILMSVIFVAMIFAMTIGCGAEEGLSVYTFGDISIPSTRIEPIVIQGETSLILPSTLTPDAVSLFAENGDGKNLKIKGNTEEIPFVSGNRINLDTICSGGEYSVKIISDTEEINLKIYFSANVGTVYLLSDNPSEKGREWVESSPDKSNKATGSMVMQNADGEVVYNGALAQIKGRGNSTWGQEKKPYQIKTPQKEDLLQTGKDENASKTWVLLANYLDSTLLNNSLVLRMGKAIGMKTNIESTYTDLYYDGEYRGSYLLSEKVEVGSGRVDIRNLDDENTAANQNTDTATLPIKSKTTKNGAVFTYCEMTSPADVSGGYLLEMDYEERAKQEICFFCTKRGQYIVVKSPEYASEKEMEYIASFYQEFEDAVYNRGVNPTTGKNYTEYVDGESLACYYIINEFTKARDFFGSSAYMYKDSGEGKLYMGPLWDYDLSLGKSRFTEKKEEPFFGESPYKAEIGEKLLEIDGFGILMDIIYRGKVYPLIQSMVSEADSGQENSLWYEKQRLMSSAKCNALLWHPGTDWETEVDALRQFMTLRADFLKETFNSYAQQKPDGSDVYRDVRKRDWFFGYVADVKKLGYMKGVDENYFDPYAKVCRGEAAQVFFNMSYAPKTEFREVFSDIKESLWYADAVLWAYDSYLMRGFSDGLFRPEDYITRAELAVVLYRYAQNPPVTDGNGFEFADWNSVPLFAEDAVKWAVGKGILKGDTDGRINPGGYLTRAELATMIVRFENMEK